MSLRHWICCGDKIPKNEIVYLSQIIILYTIILVCMFNLSYKKENKDIWIALLSYCLGCLLPSPVIIYGSLGGLSRDSFITIHHIQQVMKVKRQFIMQLEEKENIKYLTSKLGNGFRIKMPIV